MGGDFTFVGRQRRLRAGDQWFRVDLLFFHRRLRCLVIIDLKLGEFTHADAGQMHLYLNYAREHWTHTVLAAEYRAALPTEATLTDELARTRRLLESRQAPPVKSDAVEHTP